MVGDIDCLYCGNSFEVDDIEAADCTSVFTPWICPYCSKINVLGNNKITSVAEFRDTYKNYIEE